jgi:hypothetical protein
METKGFLDFRFEAALMKLLAHLSRELRAIFYPNHIQERFASPIPSSLQFRSYGKISGPYRVFTPDGHATVGRFLFHQPFEGT